VERVFYHKKHTCLTDSYILETNNDVLGINPKMKLWSDRFKPHIPFVLARRKEIQTKWDQRRITIQGKGYGDNRSVLIPEITAGQQT
jgi:hypothetical protein